MNYARPEPSATRLAPEEAALIPTAAPICPFLGWPVATDPRHWTAQVAVLGIQHSEPYAGDPRPNDQARARTRSAWYRRRSPMDPTSGILT